MPFLRTLTCGVTCPAFTRVGQEAGQEAGCASTRWRLRPKVEADLPTFLWLLLAAWQIPPGPL